MTIRSEAPSCLVAVQQPGRYEIVTAEQAAPWQLPRTFAGAFGPQKTEHIPAKRGDLTLHLRHRGTGTIAITIYDVSRPWSQQILQQQTPGEQQITVAIPADGVYLISVEMDYDRDNQWILNATQ